MRLGKNRPPRRPSPSPIVLLWGTAEVGIVDPRRFMHARPQRLQSWPSRSTSGSFLLAMFGHAGPVRIDLLVTPEVLRITGGPDVARVNGLRALLADTDAAAVLRVARRCQRAYRKSHGKRRQTFPQVDHDASPFHCRLVTRHLGVAGDLDCCVLLQSAFLSKS